MAPFQIMASFRIQQIALSDECKMPFHVLYKLTKAIKQNAQYIFNLLKSKLSSSRTMSDFNDAYDAGIMQPEYTLRPRIKSASGTIEIRKDLTETIIPSRIKGHLRGVDLDHYIAQLTLLNRGVPRLNSLMIFDYNFYDKRTGNKLYCIAIKKPADDGSAPWEMMDTLCTFQELERAFGDLQDHIVFDSPVIPSNEDIHRTQQHIYSSVKHKKSKWNKVPIRAKKKKTQQRFTLSIKEIQKQLKLCINRADVPVVPILVFNDAKQPHTEYVHIVSIGNKTDIGIAYKYTENGEICNTERIILDKEYLIRQHRLLYPQEDKYKHILDHFNVNIDWIHIGNPDDKDNMIKSSKKRCHKLTKFIKDSTKFMEKIADKATKEISDALNVWTEHSKYVITNGAIPSYLEPFTVLLKNMVNYCASHQIHIAHAMWNKICSYLNKLQEIEYYYGNQVRNPLLCNVPHPVHLPSWHPSYEKLVRFVDSNAISAIL